MFEKLCAYCEREWKIVKDAPLACLVLFGISCTLLFFIMSWYYRGRLDTLKDQIRTYEVKLDVVSPDEALEKMTEMNSKLNTAMELAEGRIDALVLKKREIDNNYVSNTWLEPICVSLKDTEDTKRQVLVYNLMGRELGIKPFFDDDFCRKRGIEMKEAREERERDAILKKMLETPPKPNKPLKDDNKKK